jgi:hypothetical protein
MDGKALTLNMSSPLEFSQPFGEHAPPWLFASPRKESYDEKAWGEKIGSSHSSERMSDISAYHSSFRMMTLLASHPILTFCERRRRGNNLCYRDASLSRGQVERDVWRQIEEVLLTEPIHFPEKEDPNHAGTY